MSTTEVRRGDPVTTVLTWEVRPGREQEFELPAHGLHLIRDAWGNLNGRE